MKKLLFFSTLAIALLLSFTADAQAKKVKGNFKSVGKITELNVEFNYDNMGVGKFEKEEDYINKKRAEYNEKEPGRGDRWAESWKADRKNRFQPAFLNLFSKHSGINAGENPNAKYTLIFYTTFTEPGFNVGVWRENAYINGKAVIVETANRNNVIAEFSLNKMPGRDVSGYDFDTGERIEEAYAKSGKDLGALIKKEMK